MTSADQMTTRADAVITVREYEPAAYQEPAGGPVLTKIQVEESLSGDIFGLPADSALPRCSPFLLLTRRSGRSARRSGSGGGEVT